MKSKLSEVTVDDIGSQNKISNFYPFKVNDTSKSYEFNEITGLIVSYLTSRKIEKFDFDEFKELCIKKLRIDIDDKNAIELLSELFFAENRINIDSLLIKQIHEPKKKSKEVSEVFNSLLNSKVLEINFNSNLNFLEETILKEFKTKLKEVKNRKVQVSYLTFLEKKFQEDLEFLSTNNHYFNKHIEKFLELYLFIYFSQLALNIQPIENALSIPSSKKLYFILSHEKSSKERKNIEEHGYKELKEKSKYIFPYFSLLSIFSRIFENEDIRLYQLEELIDNIDMEVVKDFYKTFRQAKKLPVNLLFSPSNNKDVLKDIFNSSFEQFKKGNEIERNGVLNKYVKGFENNISKPFLVNRGRSGNVLVLDQDKILLITNISIAEDKKIRFQDLLKRFEARGIYFDMKSQIELLNLYERIGNIERKSDSGDAVYVKTTI